MFRSLIAAAALLAVTACGGLDEVDISRSASATVPGGPGGTALSGASLGLDFAIGRDALQQEGIDPDDVDSARLVGLRLEALSGASLETWLEAVAYHVEAPGLPRVLVAQRSSIGALPDGTRSIELEVPGVDLKPYVLAPNATVTAEASGSQPAEDTEVRATATIRVDVNVSRLFR
jgi:hypothetical protein